MESYIAQNASAKAQMDFQERMSNTAHQREVADLKAAGLNPVLSAHGQGAATPNGAEGYIGDALAQSLDALSLSVTQNAKTMNSAVSALGRAAAGGAGRSASSISGSASSTSGSGNLLSDWIDSLDPNRYTQLGRFRISNSLLKLFYRAGQNGFRNFSDYVQSRDDYRNPGVVPPRFTSAYNAYLRANHLSSEEAESIRNPYIMDDIVSYIGDQLQRQMSHRSGQTRSSFLLSKYSQPSGKSKSRRSL